MTVALKAALRAAYQLRRDNLLPLRREARLAGTAAVKIVLDVLVGERNQRRTAVDHTADRNPVAFAKGGDAEQMAKGVVGHDVS